jgi:hypothetical protein
VTNLMDELVELHKMNIQLMDTLTVIAARFLEYDSKYNMHLEGLDSLAYLFGKASKMLEEIGSPYSCNPVKSRMVTEDRGPEDETEPPSRFCQVLVWRFGLSRTVW